MHLDLLQWTLDQPMAEEWTKAHDSREHLGLVEGVGRHCRQTHEAIWS